MNERLRDIAERADLIVNGYAFQKKDGHLYILNLNNPDKALVLSDDDLVIETSMDDIEIQIVLNYLEKNRKFLED